MWSVKRTKLQCNLKHISWNSRTFAPCLPNSHIYFQKLHFLKKLSDYCGNNIYQQFLIHMTFKALLENILVILLPKTTPFSRNYEIILNKKYSSIIPISHDLKTNIMTNAGHIYFQKLPLIQKLWDYSKQKIFINTPISHDLKTNIWTNAGHI